MRRLPNSLKGLLGKSFPVPKKTGDLRPEINLKPLNQFAQRIHFKMENIQMAMNCFPWGLYGVT